MGMFECKTAAISDRSTGIGFAFAKRFINDSTFVVPL